MAKYDELGPVPPSSEAYWREQAAVGLIRAAAGLLDHPDSRIHSLVRAEYASAMFEDQGAVGILEFIALVVENDSNHHAQVVRDR